MEHPPGKCHGMEKHDEERKYTQVFFNKFLQVMWQQGDVRGID
jgi:hypothetical protein